MIPNGAQKIHFFRFKEIWNCLHLSNIKNIVLIWPFNKMNIVQSSKYTSRNLSINSLKVVKTTPKNTVGAFFNLKGMIVY
jgi:hypothetical protein